MIPSTWTSPLLVAALLSHGAPSDDPWLVYEGGEGPGAGKHVVLVAGDEEYRSEEVLPMLARILAEHHGFRCTVLFSTDPEDGTMTPRTRPTSPVWRSCATRTCWCSSSASASCPTRT